MTNKVALRTVEEFMADYVPVYNPIAGLFMSNSQAYSEEVGQIDFKRVHTVGDIRAKHITPKDTEIKQVTVSEAKKTLKKYFLANQYIISNLQDQRGNEDTVKQVLDEHFKQYDELFLYGEGTSNSTMLNNGLFWSDDPNYLLENSASVAAGSAADHLRDMHTKIMASVAKADEVAGRKVLMVYGTTATAKFDSLYANTDAPFKTVLADVLGPNYSLVKMPNSIVQSGNGWLIANEQQIKVHYTALPTLKAQGVNEENMYSWHNFMMGSVMTEVLAKNAIIRQPVTFA